MKEKLIYDAPEVEMVEIKGAGVLMSSQPDLSSSSAETMTELTGTWDD